MTYHLAGDSTVAACPAAEFPMSGWGALLAEHVDAPVRNLAVGGGTTESCRETYWPELLGGLAPGDTVLIQFGHNDQKDPELLGARGGYAERLRAMIADVRAREGRPILCTSVERRRFVGERIAPSHGDYPNAVRDLAHELDVPLIDLQVFTAWLYEDLGVEDSRSLLSHYPRGRHPTWPDGLVDDTHFQRRGAGKVAAFVAWSLRAIERGDGHRPAAGDPCFGGMNPDASAAVPSVGIPTRRVNPGDLMPDPDLTHLLATTTARSPHRCCFLLHVRTEKLADYVAAHQDVWEEMREALTDAGWRNYSLFLRPEDGMVVGYFEADDVDAAQDAIARAAISPRWEAAMAEYFTPGGGEKQVLPQYFHLA